FPHQRPDVVVMPRERRRWGIKQRIRRMEDQIGLADRPPQLLLRFPGCGKVGLEWAETVRAKVIGRIDATPAETTGGLGAARQRRGKQLAHDDLGPAIADERTDRWPAGVRPRRLRSRSGSPGGVPPGRERA